MVILDTSVVLKWIVAEADSDAARRFRSKHVSGEEAVIVPSLLFYELANVLRYKEEIPDRAVIELLGIIDALELSVINPQLPELEETLLYARDKDISVYDATYVVLARRMLCSVVTADAKLVKKVSESFVRLLV